MNEDLYVCEGRGWCCLIVLVGGYLLVYFFVWFDRNIMEKKEVQCGVGPVPDENVAL
jgi:hypothetical protein